MLKAGDEAMYMLDKYTCKQETEKHLTLYYVFSNGSHRPQLYQSMVITEFKGQNTSLTPGGGHQISEAEPLSELTMSEHYNTITLIFRHHECD